MHTSYIVARRRMKLRGNLLFIVHRLYLVNALIMGFGKYSTTVQCYLLVMLHTEECALYCKVLYFSAEPFVLSSLTFKPHTTYEPSSRSSLPKCPCERSVSNQPGTFNQVLCMPVERPINISTRDCQE